VEYRKQGIHYLHGNKLWVNQEFNSVVILSRSATRYCDSQSRENEGKKLNVIDLRSALSNHVGAMQDATLTPTKFIGAV